MGLPKWKLHSPNQNLRVIRERDNVLTQATGLKNYARNAMDVYDTCKIFFSDEIIDRIVTDTNRFIERVRPYPR